MEGCALVLSSLPATAHSSDPIIFPEPAGPILAHKATPEAGAQGAILLLTYYVLETLIFTTTLRGRTLLLLHR